MTGDDLIVVPVLAVLSSGAAGVALAPRNRASALLLAAGLSGGSAHLLEPLARRHSTPSWGASLLRTAENLTFLLFVAMLVGVLLTFPDGRFERSWHRRVTEGFCLAAVLAPLVQLIGSATLSANGATGSSIANVVAVGGFGHLGAVAGVVVASDPVWLLVGFLALVGRYRSAARSRRFELLPLLASIAVLAVLLVPILVDSAGGPPVPEPGFQYVFLFALSLMPIVLLVGISRRTRTLAAELFASRLRIVSAEDDVRRGIERDLHDGVQQQLVALLSLTELADRQARGGSSELPATLADVRHQITDAIEELRELVYGIRPPVLEDSGVAAALESRLRRLPVQVQVNLQLTSAVGLRWRTQTEAAAYFVACEAVTNALKHAPGAAVEVRLSAVDGALVLEIEDEGPGIARGREGGRGLVGLRDRVDSSGGELSVLPGRGGGTLIRAVFGG